MVVLPPSRHPSRAAALFCLLALSLVYSPLATPLWLHSSASCCASGVCPRHGHAHKAPASSAGMPMDCGHDMSRISSCSLACCQAPSPVALAGHFFVMPPAPVARYVACLAPFSASFSAAPLSPALDPPYPPPRDPSSFVS